MKQTNNHARSRQRRRALKMKNVTRRIWLNKCSALMAGGKSELVPASARAEMNINTARQAFDMDNRRKYVFTPLRNQRQKRKAWRQCKGAHVRKK